MIIWLTGNTGAGKTTLAKALCRGDRTILLDGDEMRNSISRELGFKKEDRYESCIRVARLAKLLETQGYAVIVAVIAPYEDLREKIREITNCVFVWLPTGKEATEEFPYEACDRTADVVMLDWDTLLHQAKWSTKWSNAALRKKMRERNE
jgi:adenylylsulfate kinase-like enzyme